MEELIDTALRSCENRRSSNLQANAHSRAAVVLSERGQRYIGCDLQLPGDAAPISAEKSAFSAATADGATSFEVSKISTNTVFALNLYFVPKGVVICSDTMKSFPVPDGSSREFMRSFGNFPVVLVNCELELK